MNACHVRQTWSVVRMSLVLERVKVERFQDVWLKLWQRVSCSGREGEMRGSAKGRVDGHRWW
jgi:hypothetical protein